jgi:STE24 endopeptidase
MRLNFRVHPARLLVGLFVLLASVVAVRAATPAFDPVAETEKLLATLPAEQRAKSDAYFEGGYWLELWNVVETIVVAWLLYRTGIAVRLRNLAERATRIRFVHGLVFMALFFVVLWIVNLPWDVYTGYFREHQYGLSNQTFGAWLNERAVGLVPGLVLGAPVCALLYLGIARFPRHWWIAASVATPFLMTLLIVIAPVFIAPLFNKYTPLTDAAVRDPILSMARANGVPADNVYQFDASKQTKRISANVSGAFHTIRVSLNDNLLNRCTPGEIQAVMGHELGHYVLNHGTKLVIYQSLLFTAALVFIHFFFEVLRAKWSVAGGVRHIGDLAGLPLVMVALGVFLLLALPIRSSISRTVESEADIFGLNAARQPDGFASTALKLSEYRKLAPGPWEEIIFFDHPSGYQRILMAMRWKAEHLAEMAATEEKK